jgi:FG-GAP-like repeat
MEGHAGPCRYQRRWVFGSRGPSSARTRPACMAGRWQRRLDRDLRGLRFRDTSCGGGLAFGDINQDGRLDLAVADHCEGVFVFLQDGQGHWQAATQGLNPARARQPDVAKETMNPYTGAEELALGDVNEDGFLDLVVTASDKGGLAVYFGDGSGKNWQEAKADGLPSSDDHEPDEG